jgi:hypothetical protein
MRTTETPPSGQDDKTSEATEIAARRSFLKAGTTAGVTGASVLTLGRKAWANGSAGASGTTGGQS